MTQERWQKLSLAGQLVNIGSEVNRVIHWHRFGDKENKERAAMRVLELIDLTISDKRWKGRYREITRLRELFCDAFLGKNEYNISAEIFKNYFLDFAPLLK